MLIRALIFLALCATPAQAAPVGALVAAVGTAFSTIAASQVGAFLLKTAFSMGLSLLAQKLRGKPKQPGMQTRAVTSGGTEPQRTVLGKAAVFGHLTYRNAYDRNNNVLVQVVELSDLPGIEVTGLVVDGERSATEDATDERGRAILSKRHGGSDHAWVRLADGSQTDADAFLVSKFAADPVRPWTSNHKLSGTAYAVLTFLFSRDVHKRGVPEVRFEVKGIPLYDPRQDSSAGGSGAQRWETPSTWTHSANPVVIIYNIMRGLRLPCGHVWGGQIAAEDLPIGSWVAAMNHCDETVTVSSGTRARYTAGLEVMFSDEPAEAIEQFLNACDGQMAELGGVWTIQVGGPGTSAAIITDDDLLATEPETFDPFQGLDTVYNAVSVKMTSPGALWQAHDLDLITDAALEAEDGERRTAAINLPAVYVEAQAAQIGAANLKDGRRFRSHQIALPPDLFHLAPMETISWTSAWNSYSGKLFEIAEISYDLERLIVVASIRERDNSDFTWQSALEVAPFAPPLTPIAHVDAGVPDFAVSAHTITKTDGTPARPGVLVTWNGAAIASSVAGMMIEVRRVGQADVIWANTLQDVSAGRLVLHDVLPATSYEIRVKALSNTRATAWLAWKTVTTADIRPNLSDLDASVGEVIATTQQSVTTLNGSVDQVQSNLETAVQSLTVDYQNIEGYSDSARLSSIASASTGSGNLAPNGSIADPALWVSHYPDAETTGDKVSPTEMWAADVDGQGTPGFLKAVPGWCWNYSRDSILINPGRKYRFSVDLRRDGALAGLSYFTWQSASSAGYNASRIATTLDDGQWVNCAYEVDGIHLLAVNANPAETGRIRPGLSLDHTYQDSAGTVRAKNFRVEDITSEHSAAAHAAAAASSASSAAASQGAAGQSATAANQSAATASTKAANATSSANSAAGSATTAAGHASAASTYATSAQAAVADVKSLQGNFDFRYGLENWEKNSNVLVVQGDDYSAGKALRSVGDGHAYYRTSLPVSRARQYRVKARIRCSGPSACRTYVGVRTRNKAGEVEYLAPGSHRYCAASGIWVPADNVWRDIEGVITGGGTSSANQFRPTTAFAEPVILANYGQTANHITEVDYLVMEDITEAKAEAGIVQSAVADIQSGLASSVTMRAKAGTSGAQLELVAASNPSGAPVSAARISASNILLNGTVTASQLIQSQALITKRAQIKSLLLDESLIAPNAISRMVHTVKSTVASPGMSQGKWVYQAPPGSQIPRYQNPITVPADTRSMYADYLSATITAPYAYDLYFWIMLNGGDVVGTLYRNSETTPYAGAAYRAVLDSHTSYSYNSGSMIGVVPNVTGTQKLTLSFAGIHGSNWTEVSNCAITLMALMK